MGTRKFFIIVTMLAESVKVRNQSNTPVQKTRKRKKKPWHKMLTVGRERRNRKKTQSVRKTKPQTKKRTRKKKPWHKMLTYDRQRRSYNARSSVIVDKISRDCVTHYVSSREYFFRFSSRWRICSGVLG